ncbi:MAG: CPBP family glutamic-type intramembrane protease, partial [Chloroflexota bacterium]
LGELLVPLVVLLLFVACVEEVVFRGLLQRAACQLDGRKGMVFIAALYASLQIGYLSVPHVALTFATGLLLAYMVHRSGSLLGATLTHYGVSVGLLLLAPFLVLSPLTEMMQQALAPLSTVQLPLISPGEDGWQLLTPPGGTTSAPATPTPTWTPTPTETSQPGLTGTAQRAVVANTDGEGVWLRSEPRLANSTQTLLEGTPLLVVGPDVTADGHTWKKVQAPDGTVGYVAAEFVAAAP